MANHNIASGELMFLIIQLSMDLHPEDYLKRYGEPINRKKGNSPDHYGQDYQPTAIFLL
jgi:hypothetical protein